MRLKPKARRMLVVAAGLWSLVALIGCNSDSKVVGDEFAATDDSAAVRRLCVVQQANAARQDGMLFENHFDGGRLNSLGAEKLSLMLKDGEKDLPLVVFMDVPVDADYKDRTDAVAGYLHDAGLRDAQFRFEQGPNPHFTTLAKPNIERVKESEGTTDNLSSRPGGSGGLVNPNGGGSGDASPSGSPNGGSAAAGGLGDLK